MSAFLETPNAIKRRRAFFAALTPMIGHDAALEAISLWEHAFGSDQPLLRGISQFAALAVVELNLKLNPNDLSVRLLEHLQTDEVSLPPDPLPLLTGRAVAPAPAAAVGPTAAATQGAGPATQTLSALLVS